MPSPWKMRQVGISKSVTTLVPGQSGLRSEALYLKSQEGREGRREGGRERGREERREGGRRIFLTAKKANLGANLYFTVFTELIFKFYNYPLSYFYLVY